jgi:hypothetical protein
MIRVALAQKRMPPTYAMHGLCPPIYCGTNPSEPRRSSVRAVEKQRSSDSSALRCTLCVCHCFTFSLVRLQPHFLMAVYYKK